MTFFFFGLDNVLISIFLFYRFDLVRRTRALRDTKLYSKDWNSMNGQRRKKKIIIAIIVHSFKRRIIFLDGQWLLFSNVVTTRQSQNTVNTVFLMFGRLQRVYYFCSYSELCLYTWVRLQMHLRIKRYFFKFFFSSSHQWI